MNVTLYQLLAERVIVIQRDDLLVTKALQRFERRVLQSHRRVELLIHVAVQRHAGDGFNHVAEKNKI